MQKWSGIHRSLKIFGQKIATVCNFTDHRRSDHLWVSRCTQSFHQLIHNKASIFCSFFFFSLFRYIHHYQFPLFIYFKTAFVKNFLKVCQALAINNLVASYICSWKICLHGNIYRVWNKRWQSSEQFRCTLALRQPLWRAFFA